MRSNRGVAALTALFVALTACTSGTESTTTTHRAGTTPADSSTPDTGRQGDPALEAALPVDPDVLVGTLDNGLTYYIRNNDSPGGRVEFRLLVDAGSVQEEDDQSGMAHFLEHMMFNGTERFPRNELIAVLESFGPRFGPDINAFTSFDETVYELSLATEGDLVDLGLEVLREWSSNATITETDVHDERGIVFDEWRLRAQGFGGRIGDAFQELILPGTIYENRLPIGTPESIETTEPEPLRRFYERWYHPERMALVAVGDFEVAEMERQIVDTFGNLENSGEAPAFERPEYTPPTEPRVYSLADEEAGGASVTLSWTGASSAFVSVGDYQDTVALAIAMDIVTERLNNDALGGTAPFLGASQLNFDYTRTINLAGFDVQTRPQSVEEALLSLMTEVKRVRSFGVSQDEFDRAMTRYAAATEQRREQQETSQDVFFADQIMAHHLAGGHLMSAEQRFEMDSGIIGRLTKDDVEEAFAIRTGTGPLILAVGPDDLEPALPDETSLLAIVHEAANLAVEDRDQTGASTETLLAVPEPAPVLGQETDSLGYTTLTYDNGATVFIWPSSIAEGGVFALAESFGGTSQVDLEDLPEAFLMLDIVSRSGVGAADAPTLQRLLADELVEVFPWISETREGLSGSVASSDLETMFKLIHLYMTAPRFDPVAVEAVLDEMETLNSARDDIPGIVFDEALNQGYYGDDPRYFAVPTPDQLADFDVAAMANVYRARFGNAGDFAFAFVGDLDVAETVGLASRYIGTLPGSPDRESWIDTQPLPPREIQVLEIQAGADPQGQVGLFFTNEFDPLLQDRVNAMALELIVNARLRDRIREELSATYSIRSGVDLQRDPDPFSESFVLSTGDPNDLQRISDEVMADLIDLQENGPTPAQFATAIEQLRTELDLIDNGTLALALTTSFLYSDQPVTEIQLRYQAIDDVTPEAIRDLARVVFNSEQRIEVQQGPRP